MGGTNSARVSIGLPVYNGERYLKEALDSILAQTFTDFELIISDNASNDGTEAICREYAARDSRIRYFRQPENRGASWNFNHVFRLSSSEYFKWTCHDDIYAPNFLAKCVEGFKTANKRTVLCYAKTILIDHEGMPLGIYDDNLHMRHERPHLRLRHLMRRLNLCNPVFGLIRSSALSGTRLIGAYNAADHVLLAELALRGEFKEVPEYLFFRRRHAMSSCAANTNLDDRAAWFDPANRGRMQNGFYLSRVFFEHLRAIRLTPMVLNDKLRCFFVTFRHWLPMWKSMLKDISRALFIMLRRNKTDERRVSDCQSR